MDEHQRQQLEQSVRDGLTLPDGYSLIVTFIEYKDATELEVCVLGDKYRWTQMMVIFNDFFRDHPDMAMRVTADQVISKFETAMKHAL